MNVCLWRSLDGLAEAGLLIDSPVDLEEEADPGTTLKRVEVVEEEEDVVSVVPALDMDRLEALIPVEEEEIVVLACRSLRSMVPHETRSIELLSRT